MAGLNTDEIVWNEVLTEAEFDLLFQEPLKVMYKHPKMIRFDPEIVEIMKLLNSGPATQAKLTEQDVVVLIIIATVFKQTSQQINFLNLVTLKNNVLNYIDPGSLNQNAVPSVSDVVDGAVGKAISVFLQRNTKQSEGINRFNAYKEVSPIRVHFYYKKKLSGVNKFLFTGSSGSPNITVCCPIPKKQSLYKKTLQGPKLKQIYQDMITDIKKLLVDITIANTSQTSNPPLTCKAGFLRVSGASSGFVLDSGYLHYDTYNPSDSQISKARESEIYSAMTKNPYLLIELFNNMKINNEICSINANTGNPVNFLPTNSSVNFTMHNPWGTFQITSVIAPGICEAGFNYQICHKVGFTINGIDASLVVMDGSGWCGIMNESSI